MAHHLLLGVRLRNVGEDQTDAGLHHPPSCSAPQPGGRGVADVARHAKTGGGVEEIGLVLAGEELTVDHAANLRRDADRIRPHHGK